MFFKKHKITCFDETRNYGSTGTGLYIETFAMMYTMVCLGTIPLSLIKRNVSEECEAEWGKRELGWSLAPMTGICASEHEFECVHSEDESGDVRQINVYIRGDEKNECFVLYYCLWV